MQPEKCPTCRFRRCVCWDALDFETRLRRLVARMAREILIAKADGDVEATTDGFALAS